MPELLSTERSGLGRFGVFDGAFREGAATPASIGRIAELGFGSLWAPDTSPDLRAVVELALAAPGLTVGTAVVSVWSTTPAELASAYRRTVAAAGDRIVLGVGISHAPIVERSGRAFDRPLDRLGTFLDQLQEGTQGVPTARLLVGANGPKALALVRDRAGGAVPYLVTPEHTALARELLGPDRLLVPVQKVVLETDPPRARALARERLQVYWGLPNYTRNLVRMGFDDADLAGGGSDRLIDALVAWGDAAGVADRVRLHLDAGADHVAIHVVRRSDDDPIEAWESLARALR